jgi:MYXO-CTERM domain-containing protein
MRLVPWLALAAPSLAWAWPADDAWLPGTRGVNDLTDVVGDVTTFGGMDLAGGTLPVGYWAADADRLYLAVRVSPNPEDPMLLPGTSWSFLFDTDDEILAGDADFEFEVNFSGPTGDVYVYANNTHATGTAVAPASLSLVTPGSATPWAGISGQSARIRASDAGTWLIELSMPRAVMATRLGLDADSEFRLAFVSGTGLARADVGDCTGACAALAGVRTDTLVIDVDLDGLSASEEATYGTDPTDADTDDDGVLDGDEATGTSDDVGNAALDCDSDGDGLFDGTEAGVTLADSNTDVAAGCFVPDGDAETTDPYLRDTDGGGLADGDEDWDLDGAVDAACWETDPNDPGDDVDTDGDGVADVLELRGADASVSDVDSDGDGIADAVEGLADPDGDCVAAFVDDDSDGDGRSDADEGDGDPDDDDVPSSLDDDSDGNGTPDADEPDGDADCDGRPDFLDPDDADAVCDPPDVDTGPLDTDEPPTEVPGGYFAGGGCSTGGPAPAWLLGLPLLFARRRRWTAALVTPAAAHAQQIDVQRLTPSVDVGPFVGIEDGVVGRQVGHPVVGLLASYEDDPFVRRWTDDAAPEQRLVGPLLTTNLVGSGVLGPVRLGVDLPLHPYAAGDRVTGTAHLGDARLSSEWRLLDPDRAPLALGVLADATLPTGDGLDGLGAARARGRLGLAASRVFGPVTVAANGLFVTGTGTSYGAVGVSPAVRWGGGVAVTEGRLSVGAEVDGDVWFGNAGQKGASPAEWRVAGTFSASRRLDLVAFGGGPLSQGIGSPDYRVGAGVRARFGALVESSPPPVEDPATEPPPADVGRFEIRVIGPDGAPRPGVDVRIGRRRVTADGQGVARVEVKPGAYDLDVEDGDFAWSLDAVMVAGGERVVLIAQLAPAEVSVDVLARRIYTHHKIFFALDSDELDPTSITVLDALAEALEEHPEILRLRVEGHTDAQGSEDYNLELSARRANSVVLYLQSVGIDPARLGSVGYGESRPLQLGESEAIYATNRRVEFHIEEIAE